MLVFDEVITGFRHGLGGYQAIAGVTPDLTTLGQGDGQRLARLRARRQGRADGSLLDDPGAAGLLRRHVQRASRHDRGARSRRSTSSSASPCTSTSSALGERTREGLRALYARLGVPVVVAGFGSVFVTYFLEGPVESYDDLLRNDVDLFVGYRRELMRHGIFELPLNLKRSHFSYAHTDEDVDRLLEATETAVAAALARARVTASPGLLHDRPRGSGQAARPAAAPEDHEHRRLGEHLHPDRVGRERRRAERARPRPGTTATSTRARSRRSG